jgi:NADPH:quinone reductase
VRKVVCSSFGPLDGLTVVEAPDVQPGAGQIVVAVEAAGVNFVDALICQGRYQIKPPLPFTPGSEVAGTIAAVGPDVDGAQLPRPEVGQRVLALTANGGYATQAVVPADAVVPIPDNLSAGQAAGLVQSYATMLYALTQRTTIVPDEWVAVLGAGGGIGLAAVDLAVSMGARVVACASSDAKLELARAAGAAATVAYETSDVDLKTAIREATDGGADMVIDPVGGPKAESALRALRWGGRYLVLGFAAGEIPRLPLNQVLLNSRTIIGVDWGAWMMRNRAANASMVQDLLGMVAAGLVHPTEPTARPLDEAPAALDDLQARRVAGKVVLTP